MSSEKTRKKILDVAEQLIAEHGIGRASLRMIVAKAGVNLAAVNYHFGSKQGLILAVFKRHIDPINNERIRLLDALEAEAAEQPIPLEKIIESFLLPAFQMKLKDPKQRQRIMRLFGRMHAESKESQKLVFEEFSTIFQRFHAAFQKSLPMLTPALVAWRMRFMLGTMFSLMIAPPEFEKFKLSNDDSPELEVVFQQIIAFVAAGFRADAAGLERKGAEK